MSIAPKTRNVALSAVFAVIVFAFFSYSYPYHVHYQEQMQLFRFVGDYFKESVSIPGGFADWLNGFLVQFFYYAQVGALIIAVLLLLLQTLMWKVMNKFGASTLSYPVSLLPSIVAFLFLCDENALLTGIIAIIASMLVYLGISAIKNRSIQLLLVLLAIVPMYHLFGSISVVLPLLFIVNLLLSRESIGFLMIAIVGSVAIAAACPLVSRGIYPYPLKRLIFGIHYHRHHYAIPILIWISAVLVPFLALLSRTYSKKKDVQGSEKLFYGLLFSCLAIWIAPLWMLTDFQKEDLFKYDFMVRHSQWNKILKTASKKTPDSPITVECTNLALAKTGHMGSDMFAFYQNGPAGLLPEFVRDYFSPIPTGEVYYQIGMINTAQTFFYEAQEGIPDFQKSARLYKNLAKTNLINGDYEVSRKYLSALKQTLFYKKWAKQTEQLLNNPENIEQDPEYAYMRSMRIKDHNFMFSQEEMDSMLGLHFVENENNLMAAQYLLSYCLLKKDLARFFECHKLLKVGYDMRHYQEAIILYWALTHDGPEGMPSFITSIQVNRFSQFLSDYQSHKNAEYMEKTYGDTYWFYYYYRFNS